MVRRRFVHNFEVSLSYWQHGRYNCDPPIDDFSHNHEHNNPSHRHRQSDRARLSKIQARPPTIIMCKTWTLRYACGHRIVFRLSTCNGKKTATPVSNADSCPRRNDHTARSNRSFAVTRVLCSGASSLRLRMQTVCGPCCRAALEREAAKWFPRSQGDGPVEGNGGSCSVRPGDNLCPRDSNNGPNKSLGDTDAESTAVSEDDDDDALTRHVWELQQQYPGATYKVFPQPGQACLASVTAIQKPRPLLAPPAHLAVALLDDRRLELPQAYMPSLLSCEVRAEDIVLPAERDSSWISGNDVWQPVGGQSTEWPDWGWGGK